MTRDFAWTLLARPVPRGINTRRSLTFISITSLVMLASLGQFVGIWGPVFGYRLAVAVMLGAALTEVRHVGLPASRFWKCWFTFAAGWLIWGLVSISWSRFRYEAIRELLSLSVGLIALWSLSVLIRSHRELDWLARGWVAAFAACLLVGVWETFTDVHLPNYFTNIEHWRIPHRVPASVFGNSNNFAAFLVAGFPFVLLLWRRSSGGAKRLLAVLIVLTYPMVFMTGSRLCLLALFVVSLVALALRGTRRAFFGGVALVAAWALLPAVFPGLPQALAERGIGTSSMLIVQQNTAQEIVSEVTGGNSGSSGHSRRVLYANQLWLADHTQGLGAGPGQFQAWGSAGLLPVDTRPQVSPHNFALEVLCQYGALVVLSAFLLFAWSLALGLRRLRRRVADRWSDWRLISTLTACAIPFTALATSSFIIGNIPLLSLAPVVVIPTILTTPDNHMHSAAKEHTDEV